MRTGILWLQLSPRESLTPGIVSHLLPEPGNSAPLTCFLVSTSRMSIRLIMMFLCVFLYFPTRSETVSQPGRPVHMKVLLPCSFHSRTCNRGTEAQLAPPGGLQSSSQPCFQERELGGMPSRVNKHLLSPCILPGLEGPQPFPSETSLASEANRKAEVLPHH